MSYIRFSGTGYSLVQKVKCTDGKRRERTLAWLGQHQTVEEALQGMSAELASLEQRATSDDEYLKTPDGCRDRSARWNRHKLGKSIERLRGQLASVRAFCGEPERAGVVGGVGGVAECGDGGSEI